MESNDPDTIEEAVKRIVVSQSMYFPWVGLLEQIRLADVFVHYDDVQLTRGFYNRVQIITASGTRWLTLPLRDVHRGQNIDETLVDERRDWRSLHRDILRQTYLKAPFRDDMLALVDGVFAVNSNRLPDITRASILALADYFGIGDSCSFVDSKYLDIGGKSSQRLLAIVQSLGGTEYITGHGARNYLDHALFESTGISVQYMDYRCIPYPQQGNEFTPYVSSLDLVANCGPEGARVIRSGSINWKDFTGSKT